MPRSCDHGRFIHHGHAIRLLGASNAAAFVALGPIMAALMAVPVFGEWPSSVAWVAILIIATGEHAGFGLVFGDVGDVIED